MCFYLSSNRKPLIAKEPITVYKIMVENEGIISNCVFFKSFDYHLGIVYRAIDFSTGKPIKELTSVEDYDPEAKIYALIVNEGFHSYISKDRAFALRENKEVVIECVIPKNTPYYKNSTDKEIVSTKIKFKRILEEK